MHWKSFKFLIIAGKIVFYLKHKKRALTKKKKRRKSLSFSCKDKNSKNIPKCLCLQFSSHPLQRMRQGLNGW